MFSRVYTLKVKYQKKTTYTETADFKSKEFSDSTKCNRIKISNKSHKKIETDTAKGSKIYKKDIELLKAKTKKVVHVPQNKIKLVSVCKILKRNTPGQKQKQKQTTHNDLKKEGIANCIANLCVNE